MAYFNTCWSALIDKFILTHTGQQRTTNFNVCWPAHNDKFILTHTGQHRTTNFNAWWPAHNDKFILTHTGQHRTNNFNVCWPAQNDKFIFKQPIQNEGKLLLFFFLAIRQDKFSTHANIGSKFSLSQVTQIFGKFTWTCHPREERFTSHECLWRADAAVCAGLTFKKY